MNKIKIKKNINMMEMKIDPLTNMIYVEVGDLKGEIDIASVVLDVTGKTKEEIIDSFIQVTIQKATGVEKMDMVDYLSKFQTEVNKYVEKAIKNLKKEKKK